MTFLTGKGMIDDALTIIKNNSSPIRAKMLVWLNITAQKLAVVRPWLFLSNGTATLTPVNNVLTMPDDYGQFQSMSAGSAFFMNDRNLLTPGEAFNLDRGALGSSVPRGYTEGNGTITLHGGGFTEDVTVNYTIEPPAIVDSTAATSWPSPCRALFQRALLDGFYEYDMDERAALGYQLSASELSDLKAWDNSRKPRTQYSRHGYRRTR